MYLYSQALNKFWNKATLSTINLLKPLFHCKAMIKRKNHRSIIFKLILTAKLSLQSERSYCGTCHTRGRNLFTVHFGKFWNAGYLPGIVRVGVGQLMFLCQWFGILGNCHGLFWVRWLSVYCQSCFKITTRVIAFLLYFIRNLSTRSTCQGAADIQYTCRCTPCGCWAIWVLELELQNYTTLIQSESEQEAHRGSKIFLSNILHNWQYTVIKTTRVQLEGIRPVDRLDWFSTATPIDVDCWTQR